MALQGFPIAVIDDMAGTLTASDLKEGFLTDLAGNMVSVPVMLAIAMSTFASVSWAPAPVEGEDQEEEDQEEEDQEEEDQEEEDPSDNKALLSVSASDDVRTDASIDEALMSGPPGLAVGTDETGNKRKQGLLQHRFAKVPKVTTTEMQTASGLGSAHPASGVGGM